MFGSLFRRNTPKDPVFNNADTVLTLEQTSTERRFTTPYRKTYDFPGNAIDAAHQRLMDAPLYETGMMNLGIDGWLLPPDALKLYELGHFCSGDILELGTYRGLSTSILANALHQSKRKSSIVTVDLDPTAALESLRNLEQQNVDGRERVKYVHGDAIAFVADLARQRRRYPFAFVDHSHRYEHVLPTCERLHEIILPGGFVLFHDYNDPRNADTQNPDYGVYQGVHDGLKRDAFQFWGVFGCTGLFRRV